MWSLLRKIINFPAFLLFAVWSNINTSLIEVFHRSTFSIIGKINFLRGVVPYVIWLPCLFLIKKNTFDIKLGLNPYKWLCIYGFISLGASAFSPDFQFSLYFGLAFIANLLVPAVLLRDCAYYHRERQLMFLTKLMVFVFVFGILYFIGDQFSYGYGIFGRTTGSGEVVSAIGTSRSSGIARFFSVAAIIAFIQICMEGKWIYRFLWIAPFMYSSYVVYEMQSRGALFGYLLSLILVFVFCKGKWKAVFYLIAIVVVFNIFTSDFFVKEYILKYIYRGQSEETFVTMTGRTYFYSLGYKEILKHPIIGQGQWADRISGVGHIHNAFIQAFMNAGILGGIPYILSWITAWLLFLKLFSVNKFLAKIDRHILLECGALMMFFTVRSIPETTTASFSIDSMVMVPVFLYMIVLYKRLEWYFNSDAETYEVQT